VQESQVDGHDLLLDGGMDACVVGPLFFRTRCVWRAPLWPRHRLPTLPTSRCACFQLALAEAASSHWLERCWGCARVTPVSQQAVSAERYQNDRVHHGHPHPVVHLDGFGAFWCSIQHTQSENRHIQYVYCCRSTQILIDVWDATLRLCFICTRRPHYTVISSQLLYSS
jgi:hypothetical protein